MGYSTSTIASILNLLQILGANSIMNILFTKVVIENICIVTEYFVMTVADVFSNR